MLTSAALQSIFWPKSVENKYVKEILVVLGAAFLLSLSAQLSLPLHPVPLTFQSVTVIFIGMVLGARLGFYTVLTYIAAGCAGLPVFAHFYSGPAIFLDPTAGYILGFLPAAALSGFLAEKGFSKSFLSSFICALLGTIIIFSFGTIGLVNYTGGLHLAFMLGVKPFIITELVKLFALSLFIPHFWKHG
jgi:biotin transport system substrate-specific component